MEHYISGAQPWAIVTFIITFILSLGMIAYPAGKAALAAGMTARQSRRVRWGILIFYLLWLGYTSILSLTGTLNADTLLPRVFVFASIPLTIILFALVGNTPLFKRLLQASTPESLIFLHVFRLEGVFFLLLGYYKLLDPTFAISAGTGDMLTAILAIPVSRAVAQKKSWSRPAAYAWNILGMLDIITLISLATVNAVRSHGIAGGQLSEMSLFPMVWFPAFAPGTILFLHVAVLRKLAQQKQSIPAHPLSQNRSPEHQATTATR